MGRHIIGRIVVFTVNFALWLSGILLIVFGSIGVADPKTTVKMLNLIDGVSNVTTVIDVSPYLEGVAIFMIVLGVFLFLLGGNGCHGIMRKNKRSICVYWIWLLGAILVEIALIIYASVYPGTTDSSIKTAMQRSLNESVKNHTVLVNGTGYLEYSLDEKTKAWQYLEFEATCCGADGGKDYAPYFPYKIGRNNTDSNVPLSCCTLNAEGKLPKTDSEIKDIAKCATTLPGAGFVNPEGCWKKVNDMIWQFNLIAIILSSCLIAAELIGVIFASRLWKHIDD